ncbi:methylamine utilization protein MauE [Lentzea tibetensis]|uniref:Methylamine utilization protein MauE n=1 Tax=Lentzea tibetensis TaxID=2591470 RepID=A0A563EX65_9PSEU|nr:MauE/DoxX family redox-associated membrane protein [Lentzea tibetensis]TWP52152.1 methylamine utilization protein MauE [Lentzea tibetensis]
MDYLQLCCRALVGVVFTLAVAGKLRGRAELAAFVDSLGGFGWFAPRVRPWVAAAVIAVEAVTVVLLALPGTVRAGFVLAAAMLAAFSGGVALAKARGREVRCRCFGSDGGLMGRRHQIRNGLLFAVSLLGLPGTAATPRLDLLALAVGAGVLGAILLAHWDDIVFVLRRPAHHHH